MKDYLGEQLYDIFAASERKVFRNAEPPLRVHARMINITGDAWVPALFFIDVKYEDIVAESLCKSQGCPYIWIACYYPGSIPHFVPFHVYLNSRDVTDKKEASRLLRQYREIKTCETSVISDERVNRKHIEVCKDVFGVVIGDNPESISERRDLEYLDSALYDALAKGTKKRKQTEPPLDIIAKIERESGDVILFLPSYAYYKMIYYEHEPQLKFVPVCWDGNHIECSLEYMIIGCRHPDAYEMTHCVYERVKTYCYEYSITSPVRYCKRISSKYRKEALKRFYNGYFVPYC